MELIEAIINNDIKRVKELLDQGIDPNFCLDDDKIRPLHFAAQKNAVHAAQLLIEYGADIHACTEIDGDTPMDIAKLHQHAEMIALLERYQSGITKH